MIRTSITPEQKQILIELPQAYVGKKVEILAFTDEDVEDINDKTTYFASEVILAKDWLTPEEDTAWKNL